MKVHVTRLGHLGDGITEGPEGPLVVPGALPGETVSGRPGAERRLEEVRVLSPSPARTTPPCPVFGRCGGCRLQHADDGFVAAWKAEQVRAALARHGLDAPIAEVVTSPPGSRRRAVLHARRTRKGILLGHHGFRSHALVDIDDCLLMVPMIREGLPALREIAALLAPRRREIALHVTASEGGLDIDVRDVPEPDLDARLELAVLAERHDLARLSLAGEVVAARRPPAQRFGRARVVPPPGGFLQATAEGEAALRRVVLDAVRGARRVVDLFAGAGTFTLPLAEMVEVHAVEAEAAALAALEAGWRATPGLRRVGCEVRDLFRRPLDPDELARFDAAVIDPPRAGARAQAAMLARAGPPVLVHLSCNPASFARDAAILVEGGYRIGPVTVIDQFRWSPHVELAAPFTRPR